VPGLPGTYRDHDPNGGACRTCGYDFDSATAVKGDSAPEPGSISICGNCGELAVFEDDRLVREPTEAELAELMASKVWVKVDAAQKLIRAGRGPGRARA
jgi:hypothetical protein